MSASTTTFCNSITPVGILLTLVAFARVRPLAAGLLAPYLAWVTYAGVLNFALWRLNPV
jgi:tryptophan-rich sensory protein